ncbi:molybdopterin oxidoreductase [Shewanella sediminis HAW-EB3]|uniref:Molybdopterin oxidoreductase n=1 Tax=Shewanella sediminis (strain HAW-EB3) TaxID=425104 RepID=A8FZG7_SHESH|nr:molybdopterin-dependent oxidoreductase [Shewanella sediminis]ABV38240.1 molybdopterin oxidoreductase [Shewanella sediminis HAW-EB3]
MSEQQVPSYCAQCISRCGCLVTVKDGVLTKVQNLAGHPTGDVVCVKGKAAPQIVYHPDRLLMPMQRTQPKGSDNPGWQPISWQQALGTIADKLGQFRSQSGAKSVCWGITTPSATAIADSFIWINRLAHAFGSPNKLFATENCNWHKDFSHAYVFGQGIGMPDYKNTDCILLWGFNPKETWPAHALQVTEAQKRGAKLIVIDPRKAGLAEKSDLWMGITPGTDGALAMALANLLIANKQYDQSFVRRWSNGPLLVRDDNGSLLTAEDLGQCGANDPEQLVAWDERAQAIVLYDVKSCEYQSDSIEDPLFALDDRIELNGISCRPAFSHYRDACQRYTLEYAQSVTGISAEQIEQMASMIGESKAVSYFSWTGTAQHQQATQTTLAIASLYGLTGCLDKRGGNVYFSKPPVNNLMGFSLLSSELRKEALGADKPLGPWKMGWVNSNDLHRSVIHKAPYKTRALIAFGGNPIATKPNEAFVRETLRELEFYVHADLFMNESAKEADIVLPVSSSWERSGLTPGFLVSQQAESLLQLRKPVIEPLGEAKSDTSIVFELAGQLGLGEHFWEGEIDAALEEVLAPTGVSLSELKAQPAGIDLGLKTHYRKYRNQGFNTHSGKLELYSECLLKSGYSPVPQFPEIQAPSDYPLILTSAKFRAHCHSQHKNIGMLNRRADAPLVEISRALAQELSISANQTIIIETPIGRMTAIARLNADLAKNVLCAQYGWQESGKNYNGIIEQTQSDPISGSNRLKSQWCRIRKLETQPG